MDWAFDITLKNRNILASFIDQLSLEELNRVPDGYNNSIIWNIAHTIATQQILVYELSGLTTIIDKQFISRFRKGTKPNHQLSQIEIEDIKSLLFSTIEQTKADYKNKLFSTYKTYTTSTKSTLSNVEEAIEFNNFHEGIHLGYILALRKSI